MKGAFLSLLLIMAIFPSDIEEKIFAYRGLANSWNMIPSRSLAGLHYIFKNFEIDDDNGLVKVSGPVIEIINGNNLGAKVYKNGFTTEMSLEDFEDEQLLSLSVFEATTRTGTNVGTAFLVGNDIDLTNRHVMAYGPEEKKWECGKFSIKLNHRDQKVDCAKVRYCSSQYDFCVIEMNKLANKQSIGSEVKPLRLTNKVRNNRDVLLLHIGNAAGLGIQASRGKGIKLHDGEFYHYAPTLGGSSGAPIFNEKGEVIGINWGHTGMNYIDDSSFNRGVLAQTIFKELIKTHPRTVREIKSFRFWIRTNETHRRVLISDQSTP